MGGNPPSRGLRTPPTAAGIRRLQQRAHTLNLYGEALRLLTSGLEFHQILKRIVDLARELVPCEGWILWALDEEAGGLQALLCHRGTPPRDLSPLESGAGIAGWVLDSGKPLLLSQVTKDPRYQGEEERILEGPLRSLLALPVTSRRKPIGVLEWLNKPGRKGGPGPFSRADLDRLRAWMPLVALALERANLYQMLSNLAITDDLTHLFNFRYLNQALEVEIRRGERYRSTVSLIFLDLDHFKDVNDRYGHLAGSKTLVEVARLLVDNLRDVDIIARYGGDEFVVVLPYTGPETAYRIAQRLQRAFHHHRFLREEGLSLKITASFGIAGYPDHARDKTELLQIADQAMYQAKQAGRDQIVLASPPAPSSSRLKRRRPGKIHR